MELSSRAPLTRAQLMHAPWSSAAHHLGLIRSPLVAEHEMYWSLGNTPFDREHAYREFLAEGVPAAEKAHFTDAALRGRPIGSEAFLKPLAIEHAAVVHKRPRGRPRKTTKRDYGPIYFSSVPRAKINRL